MEHYRPATKAENARVSVEHEVGHALAYMYFGLDFVDIRSDEVTVEPRMVTTSWLARISAAGQLAGDYRWVARQIGQKAAIAWLVEGWASTAEFLAENGEDLYDEYLGTDLVQAHEHLFGAAAWALAYTETVVDRIQAASDFVESLGGRVGYEAFAAKFSGEATISLEAYGRAREMLTPHAEEIDQVTEPIAEWKRGQ